MKKYNWDRLKDVVLPEEVTQDEVNRVVDYFISTGVLTDIAEYRHSEYKEAFDKQFQDSLEALDKL